MRFLFQFGKTFSCVSFAAAGFAQLFFVATAFADREKIPHGETSATAVASFEKTVRIGFFNLEGYHMMTPTGERKGFGYDFLQYMNLYNRWRYEYVGYENGWSDMLKMLENGEIDLLTGVEKSPEREAKFAFSENPIGVCYTMLCVRAGDRKFISGDYKNWDGMRVGMMSGSLRNASFAKFAKGKGFKYVPVYYATKGEVINALRDGCDVDAIVSSSLRSVKNEWILEGFDPTPYYAVVRKADKELLKEVNHSIEQINMNSREIRERLFSEYYTPPGADEIPFTVQEREYIARLKKDGTTIKAIFNPDRIPFSYFKDGKACGIMVDLAKIAFERAGIKYEFVRTGNRVDYMKEVQRADISVCIDMWYNFSNAERLNYKLTLPYIDVNLSKVYYLKQRVPRGSIALLNGFGILKDAQKNIMQAQENNFKFYDATQEALDSVVRGDNDSVYLFTQTAEYVVHEDERRMFAADIIPGINIKYAIGVKNSEDPMLVSVINKAVVSISVEDVNRAKVENTRYSTKGFSITGFVYENPILAVSSLTAIFGAVSMLFVYLFISRRHIYRTGEVVKKLPVRYFVCDSAGNLYSYAAGDLGYEHFKTSHPTSLADFVNDKISALIKENIVKSINTGAVQRVDYEYDGHKRSAFVTKLPYSLFGADVAVWVSQDTAELQNAHNLARANAEKFFRTLMAIGDGVVVVDGKRRISAVNPAAAKMIGYPEDYLAGKELSSVYNTVGAADGKSAPSIVEKVFASAETDNSSHDTELISLGGKRYSIDETAAPIKDDSGAVNGVVLVFKDVTQERNQRDKLRERNLFLEAASDFAKITYFVYSIEKDAVVTYPDQKYWPRRGGKPISAMEWMDPQDYVRYSDSKDEIMEGSVDMFSMEYRAGEGALKNRHFEIHAMRVTIDEFRRPEVIGSIREITAEIIQRAERDDAYRLNQAIMDNMPAYLLAKEIDNDYRIAFCNRLFCQLVGKLSGEIIGRADSDVSSGSCIDLTKIRADDIEAASQDGVHEVISHFCGVDGVKRIGKFYRKVLYMSNNKRLLFISIFDITKQEEDKLRLSAARKEALAASKAKSFFLASMSHEIRTPLNSVIGFANLLKNDSIDENTQREYANSISIAGNALLDLINDILDLSKLESGNLEINPSLVNFKDLCSDIGSVFSSAIEQKGIVEEIDIADMPNIYIDRQRVRQILFNLVGNAVKFTESGKVSLRGRFEKIDGGIGVLMFCVEDTGVGISREDQKNLFQPFVQSKALRGTHAANNGTGLGLAICRQMLARMNGTISVDSAPGRGSVFAVKIENVRYSSFAVTKKTPPPNEFDGIWENKNVLLVDDVKMNLKVLSALMKRTGANIFIANSAREALDVFKIEKFFAVFTDMWMPEISGAQLAQMLRKTDKDVLIFAVTADVEIHKNFDTSAIDGTVTKPVTLEAVNKLVASKMRFPDGGKKL